MKRATWFQVTAGFIPGFHAFWQSLLHHHPRELFGDVIIQGARKDQIPEADDRFIFKSIYLHPYRDWPVFEPRIRSCYAKLEALTLVEYDQVVVFDVDMICTGSIEEVLDHDGPFVGVGVAPTEDSPHFRHNGGFWCARPPALGDIHLLSQLKLLESEGRFYDKCDQSAMVAYLEHREISSVLFPPRYNLQTGWAASTDLRSMFLSERHDCRILHFTGPCNPWHPKSFGYIHKQFRPLWYQAMAGDKLTARDVEEIDLG